MDIIKPSANVFSVAAADVLQNLYQTAPGNSLVSGYTSIARDISALLLANQGQTLRLRFTEVDNVAPLNLGVDNVDINVVPEPASGVMIAGAIAGLAMMRRRKV